MRRLRRLRAARILNTLDAAILGRADLVVADSISQCLLRGEIHHAIKAGKIAEGDLIELGNIIAGKAVGRCAVQQISVADLTGVAVQDIQIAGAVYAAFTKGFSNPLQPSG
jgi:ornithine cyclodeaminase